MSKTFSVRPFMAACIVCVVIVFGIVALRSTDAKSNRLRGSANSQKTEAHIDLVESGLDPIDIESADPASSDSAQVLHSEFRRFLQDLRAGLSPKEVLKRLGDLKAQVHDAPPHAAASSIIAELRAGEDFATGLDYAVGAEGVMEETPSYRTALLDLLGQTDPFLSADYARELMANTASADEYSLALRNLAWTNFGRRLNTELEGYFAAMVARDDWRKKPTSGFLEAFDVPVATQSVDQIVNIISKIPESFTEKDLLVGRAAFVALDRLTVANPTKLVEAFRSNPQLLADEPVHRASIMSRLDVRKADQAALLRDYLKNSKHGAGELEYFTEIFPNMNYFSSHRLITPWQSGLSISEVDQLDRATVQVLAGWLSDPELSNSAPSLHSIITRLESFTRSSSPSEPSLITVP